ncbi:MAG: insulinase family protein [Spirochaetaceae bacterium]|jgi:zinc protease|nr:insulinase family protein [Spirochaetaceae bacterium]
MINAFYLFQRIRARQKARLYAGGRLFLTVCLICGTLGFTACTSGGMPGKADPYGGLGQAADPVPFMTEARTGTLPNGLRYYILENERPENRALLALAVNAGSVLETEEERGLAHFTEHMAFNGTRRFPQQELLDYLRSLGMRFGPDVNAYTSFDETVFSIEAPVETGEDGIKRIPARTLAVLDDWSYGVTFTPEEVDSERAVILEEYRSSLGAGERILQKMLPVLFRGSPYAERLPIGLPAIIQNAPASRLENFYKTWYRTDNMAVVLVGDFDGAVLEAELAAHFTAPVPDAPINRPVYELPKPKKDSLKIEIITDPEYPYPRIDIYYREDPQPRTRDLAFYRQGLINALIDQIITLRIEEAASKPETPYIAAGGWEARYGRESRFYVLSAIAKSGAARETLAAILREKESISRYGFTAGEIDRAKRSLVSNFMQQVSEKDRQQSNSFIESFVAHFLQNQNVSDVEWELDAVTRMLPGINAREIQRAAKNYFASNDITLFLTAPESETANLPNPAEIQGILRASRRERIPRPKETPVSTELLDKAPDAGYIIDERRDAETGAVHWELSNGAQVILKETNNKRSEIILYAIARGGVTGAPESEEASVNFAAEMMNVSGMGPYSRMELLQKLADKQVSIAYWTGLFHRGFEGYAAAGDLKTLFELLYIGFTQPRFDPGAVAAMIDQYRTILAQRDENPDSVFSDEISRITAGNNRFSRPVERADLERIRPQAALEFVQQGLGPQDYTFVFTGNVDIPVIRDYVETYLAAIPRTEVRMNTWTDPKIQRPGKTEKTIYKGKEEKSLVFMGWFLNEQYDERQRAAALALTEYLDIILMEEIREKLGGVYSISAQASLSSLPPEGELTLSCYFASDPRRAVELSDAVIRQLERIAEGTINAETFARATEALRKSWEVSMQNNSYIARNYGSLAVTLGLPLSQLDKRPGLYAAITPAEIQDLCRRILPEGPARIILYPEGWKN